MRPSAPWMKNARKSSVDSRSIRRQISRQCCGGWSRGRISQPERQQPDRKDRRRFLIPGTAQRSEAKEEKREKDCRYRHRAYGRGLRDSIRKKDVARGFDPRIACGQFFDGHRAYRGKARNLREARGICAPGEVKAPDRGV